MEKNVYLLKDVSRLTGLSVYTVKYYCQLGLIKEVGRSQETNYRYFDETTVARLLEIMRHRKDNLSLRKIKAMYAKDKV